MASGDALIRATRYTIKVATEYLALNCTLKQFSPIFVVHWIENFRDCSTFYKNDTPKESPPELSFDILIIMLHPVVVKLLPSKVSIGPYGQTMLTTLDQNEAVQMKYLSCFTKNLNNWSSVDHKVATCPKKPWYCNYWQDLLYQVPGTQSTWCRTVPFYGRVGGASLAFSCIDWQWAIHM